MKAKLMITALLCTGMAFSQDVAQLHLKVLKAGWVTINTDDANGYPTSRSKPIQRVVAGTVESKLHSRFDMLCYGTVTTDEDGASTQMNHCPELQEGKTYVMDVGGRSVERNIPNTNKRAVWQVLEVCNDGQCQQVSTVQDR